MQLHKTFSKNRAIFLLEWRNIFAYRLDFWMTFLGSIATSLVMAYFIWKAIFTATGKTQIGPYNFNQMMFYYLMAPLCFRSTTGLLIGFIFREIYEGGLNKYLLYPLSYIRFKLITQFSKSTFYLIQVFVMYFLVGLFFEYPKSMHLTPTNTILFILSIYLGSWLYFMMATCLEFVSFWADHVWSLVVMLRFLINLFGGLLIPIALFPLWGKEILDYLPFTAIVTFPLKTFLGEYTLNEWIKYFLILTVWATFFSIMASSIYKKGLKNYSGVGI